MGVKLISAVKTVICCGLAASLFFSLSLNSASAASNAQNNNSAALERANQAYLARKYNDASGLVSRIILKDGESAAALNLMGKIYHRQNKIDEAIGQYQKALKLDNSFAEAHFDLGVALFDQGQYASAAK